MIHPARKVQEITDIRAGHFPSRVAIPVLKAAPVVTKTQNKPSLVSRLLGALRLIGKPS